MSGVKRIDFELTELGRVYVLASDYAALARRCRELEDYIDNHSAIAADYIARLQHTLDENDTLRAEVERLRDIREIASQCAANGGCLSSADLIELRELLKK